MRPYCEERWGRVKELHERNIHAVLAVTTAPVICLHTSMKTLGIIDACYTAGGRQHCELEQSKRPHGVIRICSLVTKEIEYRDLTATQNLTATNFYDPEDRSIPSPRKRKGGNPKPLLLFHKLCILRHLNLTYDYDVPRSTHIHSSSKTRSYPVNWRTSVKHGFEIFAQHSDYTCQTTRQTTQHQCFTGFLLSFLFIKLKILSSHWNLRKNYGRHNKAPGLRSELGEGHRY